MTTIQPQVPEPLANRETGRGAQTSCGKRIFSAEQGNMSVTLEIPEKLLAEAFHVSEADVPHHLRIELACALYAQNRLSLGKAAELADLDRFQIADELARRGIPRHYTQDDLNADLQYARGEGYLATLQSGDSWLARFIARTIQGIDKPRCSRC